MMNNRGMAMPTNPEAGPGDTVPAMLTPGEAVIPAPAAQNPANKPIIQSMVNEGRIKNDIGQIPTMEKPPAPGVDISIISGLDSKHIFELFMKKMSQEENQKALNKTMGVPLPMANGGMVPGYENGTDNLGESTFNDYLMAPAIAARRFFGYEPGDAASRERQALGAQLVSQGLPPEIAYKDPIVADKENDYNYYEITQQKKKDEQAEAAQTQANIYNDLLAQERDAIANDPTRSLSERRLARDSANQIRGATTQGTLFEPEPEPEKAIITGSSPFGTPDRAATSSTPSTPTLEDLQKIEEERKAKLAADLAAQQAKQKTPPPGYFDTFKDNLVGGIKEALDPRLLAKTGISYGLSSLIMQDPVKAASLASQTYLAELGKTPKEDFIKSNAKNFTPESLEAFKETGNYDLLVPVTTTEPATYSLMDTSKGYYNGQQVSVVKENVSKQEYYRVDTPEGPSYIPVERANEFGIVPYNADYHDRITINKQLDDFSKTSVANVNSKFGSTNKDASSITVDPAATARAATLYMDDVENMKINPQYQKAYRDEVSNALRDFYEDSIAFQNKKRTTAPFAIDAYYNARKLHLDTMIKQGDKYIPVLQQTDLKGASAQNVVRLKGIVESQPGNNLSGEFAKAIDGWKKFKNNPKYKKHAERMSKQAAEANHSPFTYFATLIYTMPNSETAKLFKEMNK